MEQFRHTNVRRSVTLQDVAAAAGVSSSAASVVLNGARSGTRVATATRRNILEAAARLGYRPHEVARSLATGRSHRVGVYSGRSRLDCRNPFFAEVLGGIFEGAEEHGLDTVVHTSGRNEGRLLDLVQSHALDGLIVHASPDDPIVPVLGELQVPAVAIGDPTEGIPSIAVDDRAGGTLLAQHLASRGHRHVLVKAANSPPLSALVRVEAFRETCECLGVRVTLGFQTVDGTGALTRADLRTLTDRHDRATAVMGWSDIVAESVCRALEGAGFRIPDEVAVVGFDGFSHPYLPRFELTTIHAPWAAVGREAVRHLNTLIIGGTIPMLTVMPVAFHHGSTT